ncbi:plasmolipin isoform X1 [Eleutherodactylus coqui]|uniref:Plasmolipin n=1 Tax=Eleutherodactylus coqui TaxID=57060 RepID=A0A8J6ESI8_ELECQ|nr:hypothetical protein GDO78_003341 [Eleutherodactylus coqui]
MLYLVSTPITPKAAFRTLQSVSIGLCCVLRRLTAFGCKGHISHYATQQSMRHAHSEAPGGSSQVFGFLVWALIASTNHYWVPAYGWVLFVSIFCWLVTIILFLIILLQLPRRIPVVPWPLTMFIYHVVATLLYITAFITCAASVSVNAFGAYNYNRRAAASFFACVVMIAYGVSTFFSFSEWRGSRSAASDNA